MGTPIALHHPPRVCNPCEAARKRGWSVEKGARSILPPSPSCTAVPRRLDILMMLLRRLHRTAWRREMGSIFLSSPSSRPPRTASKRKSSVRPHANWIDGGGRGDWGSRNRAMMGSAWIIPIILRLTLRHKVTERNWVRFFCRTHHIRFQIF